MNIYVDKLPKNCLECPFFHSEYKIRGVCYLTKDTSFDGTEYRYCYDRRSDTTKRAEFCELKELEVDE